VVRVSAIQEFQRLRNGPFRSMALELSEMDEMMEAWGTWAAADDAVLGVVNGEVIVIGLECAICGVGAGSVALGR
jgi:hypothetical protein